MKNTAILLFTSLLLISCNQSSKTNKINKKFSGLWKLHIIEQQDSVTGKWSEWNNGRQGYILYDGAKNMAIHLTPKGYENVGDKFQNTNGNISIEEIKHKSKSYVYFAKYTINEDEKFVEHARVSHSNPNEWNVKVKRWYEFKGDTLTLTTSKNKEDSPMRVVWVK